MTTRLHTAVNGHRIEYTPTPEVAAFLDRLAQMVDDPDVTENDMVALAYGRENPFLEHDMFPGRGAVTKAVLADPAYHVMADLLFRKRLLDSRVSPSTVAERYSMTVADAASVLRVHESAIRQAIAAGRIASWIKDGCHYLEPQSVRSLAVRSRRPKAERALHVVTGHAAGTRLKVKTGLPLSDVTRLEGNIVRGRLDDWRRVVVVTVGAGGSKRAFVLEPGPDENTLEFGPFSVRGHFVIAEKANSAKSADRLWETCEVL